jgi:uncharacterized membrane protein YedE/YeeE
MNWFFEPWNWYIAGPLIGLFVPAVLIISNKALGISSAFDQVCMMVSPQTKKAMFAFKEKENSWKIFFVIGIGIGAFIVSRFLSSSPLHFLPEHYHTVPGYVKLFAGGILVGFGTRYANGCTSGHSIFGLSILSSASLKATLSFFAGGLLYTFIASLF